MIRLAVIWFCCAVVSSSICEVRAQDSVKYNVYLRSNYGTDTMHDGRSFRIYGMTHRLMDPPTIPAPPIFCNEGDTVILNAVSISQKDHHTIHLHGLDVDTRNDGDPATSFYLSHLQDTTYSFRANHAGTYIYHCHVADVSHVQMGMYGLVIVRAKDGKKQVYTNGPEYNQEYNWISSEIDPAWHDSVPVHDDSADVVYIPQYRPQYFLINGKSEWELAADSGIHVRAKVNEPVLLRVANIGFYHNRLYFPEHLQAIVYEADGRVLPQPWRTDSLDLSPGERYGILILPQEQGTFSLQWRFESMNTRELYNVQHVPISVQGAFGISDGVLQKHIKLWPNPADDHLYFKIPEAGILEDVQVIGSLGSEYYVPLTWNNRGHGSLSTAGLPSGLYQLRFKGSSGAWYQTKFLIAP